MRQDLKMLKTAIAHGFTPEEGVSYGDPYSFVKGIINVWQCIHNDKPMWCRAILIGDMYQNHRYFDDLKEALES